MTKLKQFSIGAVVFFKDGKYLEVMGAGTGMVIRLHKVKTKARRR